MITFRREPTHLRYTICGPSRADLLAQASFYHREAANLEEDAKFHYAAGHERLATTISFRAVHFRNRAETLERSAREMPGGGHD